jgi:hypothetical protein
MMAVVPISLFLVVVRPASAQSPPAANSGGTAVDGVTRHRANTLNPQPLPPIDKPVQR